MDSHPHNDSPAQFQPGLLPCMLLLALGSGLAALIYEVVWFQVLELVIGSSAVSLAVLLAAFMGGTCLGSLMLPRIAPTRFHPMRIYAAIEFGIAFCGVSVLLQIPLVSRLYTVWSGYGLRGFLLRGIVAAACLLIPTMLMGATLPALARGMRATQDGVTWIGFFYGANIAGAVFGCLLAGFYLLRQYDVTIATFTAAAVNIAVAVIALALASVTQRANLPAAGTRSGRPIDAPVYIAIALSGLCALSGEAIWTRLLGLLLGASVYTLSIILAVFLAGLGIGSSIGSLLSRVVKSARLALAGCQLLAAAAIAWTAYSLSASLPYWPINPSMSSNIWFTFQLDLDRAFWALLPPTMLWGASFPLALAAAATNRDVDGGKLFAGIYAANTIGAIAGAIGTNLFLIGWVGSQRSQQLLIALSVLAGLLLLLPSLRLARTASISAISVLAAFLLIRSVPPVSKLLIAHGRYASTWVGKSDVIYAREGLNSSVAVSSFPNGARTFHVAGKIQASNVPRDMRLQRMLGHLTSLTPAHPRSILVIGCGAGITAGAVSVDPGTERVTIVEIEPLVPQTAETYFAQENFKVLRNPKVELHIDDGRHYLLTTKHRFDAITADPLDPWVKGAANLYTEEFLEAAKQHLNPGGVVTMYMQLFETNVDAVKSAMATFFKVFPNGTVWGNTYQGQGHDMVMLGSIEPLRIDIDKMDRQIGSTEFARVAQSLAEVGMHSAVDLFSSYAGRASDLSEWLKDAAINRDRNLRMQYLAGSGLDLDDAAAIYAAMLAYRRFPSDLFVGTESRLGLLRNAIQATGGIQ